jgi:hypothetical protein
MHQFVDSHLSLRIQLEFAILDMLDTAGKKERCMLDSYLASQIVSELSRSIAIFRKGAGTHCHTN